MGQPQHNNLKDGDVNDLENEANTAASEKLKHRETFDYLMPHTKYLTVSKVEECAALYAVHPAIIIGKLAHEKAISYSNQSLFKADVQQFIDPLYQF